MTSEQDLERTPQRPFWEIDPRIVPRWVKWLIGVVDSTALLVIILDHVPASTDWISDTAHSLASYAIFAMVILLYVTHYRAQRREAARSGDPTLIS